jgi:hypothetical protein
MEHLRRRDAFLLAATFVALAMLAGCGDGKPYTDTSLNEVTVTGIVTAKGEPVTAGTIVFNPSNSGRKVPVKTATIGPDGHYTIKTYTGDNQVSYGDAVAKKYPGVGLRKDYASVQSGENKFDFDILGEGGKSPTIDLTKKGQRKKN